MSSGTCPLVSGAGEKTIRVHKLRVCDEERVEISSKELVKFDLEGRDLIWIAKK